MQPHTRDPGTSPIHTGGHRVRLPTELGSRLVQALAQSRIRWWKRLLISTFIRHFSIRLDEAVEPDAERYPSFNAFFTRALRPEARPLAPAPALLCPVDGQLVTTGQAGFDGLVSVKGQPFTWTGLLGQPANRLPAGLFDSTALFFNLYLAPGNYHRVHLPAAGTLRHVDWIPGRFVSVSPGRLRRDPDRYVKNERVVLGFDTRMGPLLLVLVAARLVGGIETVWCKARTSRRGHDPSFRIRLQSGIDQSWDRGQEIARFNYGSTVILLVPGSRWNPCVSPDPVQFGLPLAKPSRPSQSAPGS